MNYIDEEHKIIKKLDEFIKINLKELDEVKLLNRIDSKYIVHVSQFIELLDEIKTSYKVLKIEDKMIHSYESLYFIYISLTQFRASVSASSVEINLSWILLK